jgi:hypothetical protein
VYKMYKMEGLEMGSAISIELPSMKNERKEDGTVYNV